MRWNFVLRIFSWERSHRRFFRVNYSREVTYAGKHGQKQIRLRSSPQRSHGEEDHRRPEGENRADDRITHRFEIASLSDIDDEVKRWLKKAYDMDASPRHGKPPAKLSA